MERGTAYVLPVGGDVPASTPLAPLVPREAVDGGALELAALLEHAARTAQLRATTQRTTRAGSVSMALRIIAAPNRIPPSSYVRGASILKIGHNVLKYLEGLNVTKRYGAHKISIDPSSVVG
jgi:hypothetical protein